MKTHFLSPSYVRSFRFEGTFRSARSSGGRRLRREDLARPRLTSLPASAPAGTMFAAGGLAAACAGSACASATCSCFHAVGSSVAKISARALYVALFALTTVLAVVMRDYAKPALAKLPWIVSAAGLEPGNEWFGAQAVYRVSMGAFVFFAVLSATLVNVRTRADPRDRAVHHGNWTVKMFLWSMCVLFPFFLEGNSAVLVLYVWVARVASGSFLVAQAVLLLDFAFQWNAKWLRNSERASDAGDEKKAMAWVLGLVLSAVILYGGAVAFFVLSYARYVGDYECRANAFLISVTLVFVVLFTSASAHPRFTEKGASVLPAAVVAAYCAYLVHAALASEPESAGNARPRCVPAGRAAGTGTGRGELGELAGAALTLLSVAYSAFRAGSADFFGETSGDVSMDGTGALLGDDSDDVGASGAEFPAGPPTYSYSFFHAVFASASAYLGMLLTGWGERGSGDTGGDIRDVDSGWVSVWVKILSAWITSLLYSWTVVAPAVVENRDFF